MAYVHLVTAPRDFKRKGGVSVLYEKLNQQKKKMGITTEQLSRLSGVPVGTINKILRG